MSICDLGQGSLVKCLLTYFKDFLSGKSEPISSKFHIPPLGKMGKTIYIFGPDNMTKMATMHIYSKKLIFFLELLNDCLETEDVAFGEIVLLNFNKQKHWVDPDLFLWQVKIGPSSFRIGKVNSVHLCVAVVFFDIKMSSLLALPAVIFQNTETPFESCIYP